MLKGRPNLADAGCNSDTTQNSITPCAGFEDEDEDDDEDEGPHEGARARRTKKKRPEVRALFLECLLTVRITRQNT